MKQASITLTRHRSVAGELVISDPLPRFEEVFPAQETYSGVAYSYDHSLYGDTLIRVLATQSGALYTHVIPSSLSVSRSGEFVNSHWSLFPGVSLMTGSRVAAYGKRIFFQNGSAVSYADWTGSGFSTVTAVRYYTVPVSIAPVSEDMIYIISPSVNDPKRFSVKRFTISSSAVNGMPGYIFSTSGGVPVSAAVSMPGEQYLYFTVDDHKRTMFVRRDAEWSEVYPVVPLDIVDDTSLFRLTGVYMAETGPVISGVLRRTYGMDMHVYLCGPDNLTMGREFFIRPENTDGTGKFVELADGGIWYIGPGIRWRSEKRGPFGGSEEVIAAPASIQIDMSSNRAYNLQAELPPSFDDPRLRPGSVVRPQFCINGEWIDMGPFNIDNVTRPKSENGPGLSITARSDAMKRLNQWRSDASFDYWSQTKLSANPSELTKVLRVSGAWNDRNNSVSQEKLNVDGVMYVNAKACRGAEMRARFTPRTGDFKTRFGVGVNFYRETKYEAAERLGIKSDEVQDDQCGLNGIFALYGPVEHNGGAGLGLYQVSDNTWQKLASTSLSIAGNYWLMIRFIEGEIMVYGRSGSSWTQLLSYTFDVPGQQPWKRDQIGRGAIYMRPITPYSTCYAFGSDQDIIPVENNAAFNNADIVMVDSEKIRYSGKSGNINIKGLQYRFGDLVASGAAPSGRIIDFANHRETARIIQTFSLPTEVSFVRALKVWAKKVNYPVDALHAGFWRGPKTEAKPIGDQVNEVVVPSENITPEGGWVTFKFGGQEIRNGDWFILARGNNPTHPESVTYYAVDVPSIGESAYHWDEQNDLWVNLHGTCAFEIYGGEAAPNQWYSVYVAPHSSLSTVNGSYLHQALVVTDGAGKGSCFRIVGYIYRPNQPCIFYVDRSPQLLDESSVLAIVPTLLVSKTNGKLDRGVDGTNAAAHLSGRQVDTWREPPYILSDQVDYYSSDVDLTLEDMTRVIARKAGIRDVNPDGPNLFYRSDRTFTGAYLGKNTIVDIDAAHKDSVITVGSRCSSEAASDGVFVEITKTAVTYKKGTNTREVFPVSGAVGKWRVSIYDNAISVWKEGRFVHAFTLTAEDAAVSGAWSRITVNAPEPVTVRVSEPNRRVDNFILDAGRSGEQLLSELIGEKRFWYQDNPDGTLRLFGEKTTVNTPETAYDLAAAEDETHSDSAIATRVRLEGSDVREELDPEMMVQYGNIFYQANMKEINSPDDAEYYVGKMLEDFNTMTTAKNFTGAADPRIEPGDQIYVSIAGNLRLVIVDSIGFVMDVDEQSVLFDMNIVGRVLPEG